MSAEEIQLLNDKIESLQKEIMVIHTEINIIKLRLTKRDYVFSQEV